MIRRPPRSTHCISSAASDVYKRQVVDGAEDGETDMSMACPDWDLLTEGLDLTNADFQFNCEGPLAECCPEGSVCDGTRCVCPDGLVACDGNLLNGCNCEGCLLPNVECDGSPETFCETNVSNDPANCGACGASCPSLPADVPEVEGIVCEMGQCVLACEADFADCDGVPETGCEVNTDTDSRHCGGCGITCTGFEVCEDGACECARGTLGTRLNCSECGDTCTSGRDCFETDDSTEEDKKYVCRCPDGEVQCNGRCVETESNDRHCGGCGMPCGQGAACIGGVCECADDASTDCRHPQACCGSLGCQSDPMCPNIQCGPGTVKCGNTCVSDILSDPFHCGACGNACSADEVCVQGECRCGNDPATAELCSGPFVCRTPGGSIEPRCDCPMGERCPPFDQCFDTLSDPQHCGDCLTSCTSGPNVDPAGNSQCIAGQCQLACAATFADCDNDPKNGCESDLNIGLPVAVGSTGGLITVTHCGQCGVTCAPDQTCRNGQCECLNGGQRCNSLGGCLDTNNDPAHCGACGNACGQNEICSNGMCVCSGVPCGGLCCTGVCVGSGLLCL